MTEKNQGSQHVKLMESLEKKADSPISEWTKNELLLFHCYVHTYSRRKTSAEHIKNLHDKIAEKMREIGLKHMKFDDILDKEVTNDKSTNRITET